MRGELAIKVRGIAPKRTWFAVASALALACCALVSCRPAPEKPPLETAQALFDKKQYREARIELMSALQRAPNDRKLLMLAARTNLALQQGADAATYLKKAREQGVAPGEIAVPLARALLQQRKAGDALAELANVDSPVAARLRGQAHLMLGEPDKARAEWDAAVKRYPNDASLLTFRAALALDQGQIADANSFAQRAVASAPDNPAALMIAGDSARAANDLKAASSLYDRALARSPDLVRPKLGQMAIFAANGNREALAPLLDDLLGKAPNHPQVIILKAQQLAQDGENDAASDLLRKKAAILAKSPDALMVAGEIALNQHSVALAIDRFEEVLRQSPGNGRARYLLARAYLADGDKASAQQTLTPLAGAKDMPDDLRALLPNNAPPSPAPPRK